MHTNSQGCIPIFIDEAKPVIADLAGGLQVGAFQPADDASIRLVRCLEAVRDLRQIVDWFDMLPAAVSNKRQVKNLAVPLFTLAEAIVDLYGQIRLRHLKGLPKVERQKFVRRIDQFRESTIGAKNAPLTAIRNKLGAHIDKNAVLGGQPFWGHVVFERLMIVLERCLQELDFLIRFEVYAWSCHSDDDSCFRLMTVDGNLTSGELGALVDIAYKDGEAKHLAQISYMPTPRLAIIDEINAFVAIVNRVIGKVRANNVFAGPLDTQVALERAGVRGR